MHGPTGICSAHLSHLTPSSLKNVLYVLVDDLRPELQPFGQKYVRSVATGESVIKSPSPLTRPRLAQWGVPAGCRAMCRDCCAQLIMLISAVLAALVQAFAAFEGALASFLFRSSPRYCHGGLMKMFVGAHTKHAQAGQLRHGVPSHGRYIESFSRRSVYFSMEFH